MTSLSGHGFRNLIAIVLLVAGTIAFSGCTTTGPEIEPSEAAPVTLTGAFGDATVPGTPGRVVALSTTDADLVLAAGATPIAVPAMPQTDAATNGTSIYPWQVGRYPAGTPRLDANTEELNVEAVAAFEPDLIVATGYFGLTEQNYAQLSAIAPVVHFDSEANADPWQDSMRKVATALGNVGAGDAAVATAEGRLAEIRQQNPDFKGLTFNAVISPSNDGVWILCSPDDNLGRVMADFGLVLSDYAQSVDCDGGKTQVSWEVVPKLDADVLWLIPDTADQAAEFTDRPLWLGLPAVKRGAVAVVPKTEGVPFALGFPSPLSIVWAAEQLAPLIADAIDR